MNFSQYKEVKEKKIKMMDDVFELVSEVSSGIPVIGDATKSLLKLSSVVNRKMNLNKRLHLENESNWLFVLPLKEGIVFEVTDALFTILSNKKTMGKFNYSLDDINIDYFNDYDFEPEGNLYPPESEIIHYLRVEFLDDLYKNKFKDECYAGPSIQFKIKSEQINFKDMQVYCICEVISSSYQTIDTFPTIKRDYKNIGEFILTALSYHAY